MTLTLSRLTERDAVHLSSALLPHDEAEVRLSGWEPITAITFAANRPDPAFCLKDEKGWPLLAFGAAPGHGCMDVWMVATEGMKISEVKWVLRNFGRAVEFLKTACFDPGVSVPTRCMVWAHNTLHVRWLLSAGFRPTGRSERRANAEPFLEFELSVTPPSSSSRLR